MPSFVLVCVGGGTLLTVFHIYNRIFFRKLKFSPYKLELKALKDNFVGYAENSKAYKNLDSSSNIIVYLEMLSLLKINFKLISIQLVNESMILKLK